MDSFNYILIAIIAFMFFDSFEKEKKLTDKIKKQNKSKENNMSDMLKELTGQECTLCFDTALQEIGINLKCTVLSVDDTWLKVVSTNKKGVTVTRYIQMENIKNVKIENI